MWAWLALKSGRGQKSHAICARLFLYDPFGYPGSAPVLESRLPSLKPRRLALSLSHLYKIVNKLTHYPGAPIIQRKVPYGSRGINANTVMVRKYYCISTLMQTLSWYANTTAYQQSYPILSYPKTLYVEFARSDELQ
jgi:hypothetical protein